MAIVKMRKIRLLVHKSASAEALRAVQKIGIVEFTEVKNIEGLTSKDEYSFEFNYISGRLDFAINFLSQYAPTKSLLRTALEGTKIETNGKEMQEVVNSFYFNDIIDKLQNLEESLNDFDSKLKALIEEEQLLLPWSAITVSLGEGLETSRTKTVLLTGEPEELSEFEKKISKSSSLYHLDQISASNFAVTILKEDLSLISDNIATFSIEEITLPKRRGTPTEELERIVRAKKKVEKNKIAIEEQIRDLLPSLENLKIVGDYMLWKKEKHEYIVSAENTQTVLVFEGWCPEKKFNALESAIKEETSKFSIEKISTPKGEEPPVEIENNKIIQPFETITRLYGLPGSRDLDPTIFLAGFFFLFFGMSLTDVGYGLFLFATTALALRFFKLPSTVKPLVKLLMLGGIASFIAGLFFGGYLGIDMSKLPAFLQAIQTFDPIKNPLPIFYLSLALGVIQVLFGLVLKIYQYARENELKEGLLESGPWITIFLSLILLGGNATGYIGGNAQLYTWLVYGSFLFLFLASARKGTSLGSKLVSGLVGIYDSVGFFSDVLSYSRLLALGLATSALAFAVNLIAAIIGDMVPYVGGVLMVIILVVGHLFNLAVNTLGAFIHSARLQFVEFFGKFITSSGRNFTPFKRSERYVALIER